MTRRLLASHLAVGAAGVLAGHLLWPVTPAPAAVAPATVAPPTKERRLVCTNVAAAPAPDELATRLQWCEGRLAAATRPRPTGRNDWPETLPEESPEAWTETLTTLVERCRLPVDVEVADCDEYPCVAAVRPREPGLGRKALVDRVRECPEAAAITGTLDFDAVNSSVRCPDDTREEALVLFLNGPVDDRNPAFRTLFPGGEAELADFIVFGGRRVESALQTWPCRGG